MKLPWTKRSKSAQKIARAATQTPQGIPVHTGSQFNLLTSYTGPSSLNLSQMVSKSQYYRFIREKIPLVSAAVWAWVKLCNTPTSIRFEGDDQNAQKAYDELKPKILDNPYFRGDVFRYLNELFFVEIFTVGRFAGKLHISKDEKGIDWFEVLDSYKLHWSKDNGKKWLCKYGIVKDDAVTINPETVFISSIGGDISNPFGIEPLASIPFVLQIEQQFLEDMSKSSHNAGFPRLQIKITPPAPFENEHEEEYVSRINAYFDGTVDAFKDMEIDKNIFSWDDVEVTVVGGEKGRAFTWKVHREQIIEDVITGMKLFPWVLGRSHGTTKEWVRSQYNLLMQEVDSIQASARNLAEFIINTELKLKGINATASMVYEPNKDPFEKEREEAFKTRIENHRNLLQDKVISQSEFEDSLKAKFLQT